LRKRREFLRVQQCSTGRKLHGQHFLVIAAPRPIEAVDGPDDDQRGRIGITVSKRVGSAVTRNRIKRWVREFVRHHLEWLPARHDVVVVAKRTAAELGGYAEVEADLLRLERRLLSC